MAIDFFDSVYYQHTHEMFPIPLWAKFLMELGKNTARFTQEHEPITVAVALPNRAYGAAFIATGMVGHSIETMSQSDYSNPDEYFEKLKKCPEGTQVVIYDRIHNKKTRGTIIRDIVSKDEIRILIRKYPLLVEIVSKRDSLKIQIVNNGKRKAVSSNRVISKNTNKECFAGAIYRQESTTSCLLSPRIVCLIIGTRNSFRREIEKTKIIFDENEKKQEGSIQDILRVKEFLSDDKYYYSSFLSGSKKHKKELLLSEPPQFGVIFDGASAYIQQGNVVSYSNRIIVLDKRDRKSIDAVSLLSQDAMNIKPLSNIFPEIELPAGCEVLVYQKCMKAKQ